MRIVIGIIIYHEDLEALKKDLLMFSRQTLWQEEPETDCRVVILDNGEGAQIEEVRELARRFLPESFASRLVCLASEDVGFGRGHNKIFNYAKDNFAFDYYLCCSPDGCPHPEMLSRLLAFARKNQDRGIYEAGHFPAERCEPYDRNTGLTPWVSGCCVLFPRKIYEQLKGFDKNFFMYVEDVDISWRTRLLGYGCYTVEGAWFCHFVNLEKRNPEFISSNIYISGYRLARKFRHKKFAKYCLKGLKRFLKPQEIQDLIREADALQEEYREYQFQKFMDFRHEFHFSPTRW